MKTESGMDRSEPGLLAERFQRFRFLNHSLRCHLIRDNQSDFVFLALSRLTSAVTLRCADASERRYQRLKNYPNG